MSRPRLLRVMTHIIVSMVLCSIEGMAFAQDSEESEPKVLRPAKASPLQAVRSPSRALYYRWRMIDAYGTHVPLGSIFNPYYQNPIKGDFPIIGLNTFMVMTALYTPKAVFNSQSEVDPQFNNDLVTAVELFHGSTVFKPKDWSIKASGKGFLNRGNNENEDFSFLELFGELKLFDVGSNYDFTSVRGGVQFFKSDFNGFIFQDFNLGGQLFGELSRNRQRWTLAYLSLREKENGLLTFDPLEQEVFFANWFIEDFLRPGFNGVFSLHYNRDRQVGGSQFINLDVFYLGFAAAGHWGRWVFNPAFYFAFGSQEDLSTNSIDISAFMAGVEIEYPSDYMNYRGAVFITSGDSDPSDDKAKGFDSINDNVNLFGAGNSFVVGGGQFGTRNNSFIPSFRQLGTQANFINPGMLLANIGLDVIFTPKLFFETNFNYFQFLQSEIPVGAGVTILDSKSLGFEVNGAFNYRVFLNENVILQAGVNAFFPQDGGKSVLALQGIDEDLILTGNITLVTLF